MNRNKSFFKNKIRNYPLKLKIALITALAIILTSIASLIGIYVLTNSYNHFLYQAMAGSLSYSAENISSKLSNIESMTNAIISNQYIRKSLISLHDRTNTETLNQNVNNTISSTLIDYYQNYKANDISYISLYNPYFVSSSFKASSEDLPQNIMNNIIKSAGRNSGYACWVTDYCNSYGLFLGRDSRRVQNLKFETLGTVVVSIDIDKLIQSSTKSILLNGSAQYILYENEKEIYHSKSLNSKSIDTIHQKLNSTYDIISVDNHSYFCTKGTIENNGWDYICLVPFSNITKPLQITRLISLLILFITVIIVFFLTRSMIRSISKDFGILVNKMKRFGSTEAVLPEIQNDYSDRVDEVGILHKQFDQMTIEIHNLIQKNYINEILTKDAQLKALESQVNPHFLYNALESVKWRAIKIGASDISSMVQALGDLLHATLSNKDTLCTIRHEMEIVNNYITIQKIRFDEERLNYCETISTEILDAELPQMTIQPLIDNAINHAMDIITDTCYIKLNGYSENGIIHITVTNNGSQFEDHLLEKLESGIIQPHGIGIGLLNIHQRIRLIYGSDYGLKFYNIDEDHAVAEIIIPQTKE